MPKVLEIPEVGRVQFPDTMTDQDIDQAAGELYDRHQLKKEGEAARRGEAQADTVARGLQVAEDVAGRISLGGLSRLARAAAADVVTPGLPIPGGGGRALGAELAGHPMPAVQAAQIQESPVRSGLVQAAGAVPMVGASMALMAAGVPPIPAMAGPAGIQTFEETGSLKEAGKAAGVAALIPPAGALGRAAATKMMGEAIGQGWMSAGATGAQKAIEATAGQVAVQALMEGSRLPEYIKATPEQRRFMLIESLISNVALGVPDAVTALRPGPSGTQQALRPEVQVADALRQAVQDPAVGESLQRQVDAAVSDHMSGADWAKEFVPKPEDLERPTVPDVPMIDPGGSAQRLAATAGIHNLQGEGTPESRWNAIENTYIHAKAAQEAVPGVPLEDVHLIQIRRYERGKAPSESELVDQVFVPRDRLGAARAELESLYPAGQFIQSIDPGMKPYSPRKGEPSFKEWLAGKRPTFPPTEAPAAPAEPTSLQEPALPPEPPASTIEPPQPPVESNPPEAKVVDPPAVEMPAGAEKARRIEREEGKGAASNKPETSTPKALKVQKEYLVAAIEKAIEEAPKTFDPDPKLKAATDRLAAIDSEEKQKLQANQANKGFTKEALEERATIQREASEARMVLADELGVANGARFAKGNQDRPPYEGEWRDYDNETRLEFLKDHLESAKWRGPTGITFDVPGDGVFTVVNTKEALKAFKERVEKRFPKGSGQAKVPAQASTSESGVPKKVAIGSMPARLKVLGPFVTTDISRRVLTRVIHDGEQLMATDGRMAATIPAGAKAKTPVQYDPKTGKAVTKEGDGADLGRFPDVRQVVPADNVWRARVEIAPLAKMIHGAVRLFEGIKKETTRTVTLYLDADGNIGVKTNVPDAGAFESGITPKSKLMGAFDAEYLLQGLDAAARMGNELLWIGSSKGGIPVLSMLGDDFGAVLMPMRLESGEPVVSPKLQTKSASDSSAQLDSQWTKTWGHATEHAKTKPKGRGKQSAAEGYPGTVEGTTAEAYPGGPIGTERAHPADAPGFTQFPIELPEAVRFSRDLLGGKYPRVLQRLGILKGNALGLFRHRDAPATPFGEIELRADIFDLLTPEEKARLKSEAQREAEEIGGDPAEIARMARERFEAKLEAAYEEAKTKPPLMALKVLWHEIGHLVDWLPDHMIQGRGNLFGRIASLKDYLLHTLPADPDTPHQPITEADRAKLWRQAEKQLRDELGPMQEIIETVLVEEPIFRETGVTPDMVKDLFGMDAREKTPDLYRWFAEQPAAVKKEIVKKAMQGMVDERIAKLGGREQIGTRKVERQVRKVSGREPSPREIQQRFRDLLRKEMESRRLVDLATLKAELDPLIAWWRGVPKMEAYFRPSVEMYAEAFSVFMNNPAAVAKRAPTYYRMMHDYMRNKPQVKELYEAIQDQIRAGTVMRSRVEELRGSWRRDDARSLQTWRERFGTKARDFLDNVLYHYDRRFGPVYRAARGAKAEPRVRDAVGNFLYRAAEHERFLSRMNDRVGGRLVAHNLDWADLGEYLFHRRVINERFNLANSQGWSADTSNKRLAELQAQLGPERWTVLQDAGQAFRDIYQEQVIPLMKQARLWGDALQEKIDENVFYATFAAVRNLPDTGIERALELSLGPGVTPHIYRQIGHLGEIKNPATATVLKALSLMSAAHRNIAKREIVRMLREAQPEEIAPARRRWTGQRMEAVEVNTDRVGTITFLEDGKPQSWYVPRLMADAINSGSPVESRLAGAMVGALNWQKGLFTQLNYGFWPVNFLRDSAGFFLNMPGAVGPVAAWVRNLPRSIAAARASVKGRANPDADAALRRLMLISREDPRGVLSDVVDEFELKVAAYGLDPAQWDKELSGARRAVGWWQRYREAGQAMERVNKIQGMLYLDQSFPAMPEWQKREVVRERAGSPNFVEKGASNWHADLVALFFNAWKQGIRQTVNAAKANPWSFAAKAAAGTALPSIAMAAANAGALGDDLRDAFRSIPDYDLTNYLVIPLRWVDRKQGKVAYLRLPLPESMRLFHGLLFRTLTGRGAGYAAFMGGQVPSLNPMLQVAGAWIQYSVAGQNPFDLHTGQNILDDTTFEAGGMPAAAEMGKWTWNAMGGGILHRFKNARLESPPDGAGEEILAAPGVNNLVGRWIKVSNRGLVDEDRRVTAPVEQYRAQVRLAVRNLVDRWARAGALEGQGQVAPAAVLTEMSRAERTLLRDPYAMDYLLATLPNVLQARQSPLLARIGQANSKAAKLAILSNEVARSVQPVQHPRQQPTAQPVGP